MLCVLALVKDEERYGFELVRELAAADGLVTSEGTVYPLLTRLRREGLVDTVWRESNQGPPRRSTASPRTGDGPLRASSGNGSGSGTPWTAYVVLGRQAMRERPGHSGGHLPLRGWTSP